MVVNLQTFAAYQKTRIQKFGASLRTRDPSEPRILEDARLQRTQDFRIPQTLEESGSSLMQDSRGLRTLENPRP